MNYESVTPTPLLLTPSNFSSRRRYRVTTPAALPPTPPVLWDDSAVTVFGERRQQQEENYITAAKTFKEEQPLPPYKKQREMSSSAGKCAILREKKNNKSIVTRTTPTAPSLTPAYFKVCSRYRVPTHEQITNSSTQNADRKPGQPIRRRIPYHKRVQVDRGKLPNPFRRQGIDVRQEKRYHIIFLRDSTATVCYGCDGKFRERPSDVPPPAPLDIAIKTKMRRSFRARGSLTIRVTKDVETVHFHPVKSCCAAQNIELRQDNFLVEKPAQLLQCHSIKLRKEFVVIA